MSPKTKGRVLFGRRIQLGLRVLTLLGAAGSLFCAIVIQNLATSLIWIIRVGVSEPYLPCDTAWIAVWLC